MSAAPPSPVGGPWSTRRRFRVNYHDLDPLNHLNHAVYFPWMETLRCDYYLPFVGSTDPRDLDIIIAEATCRYLRPIVYGEEVVGEVTPAHPLGKTSFTLLYRFQHPDSGEVVARGKTVVVCYDYPSARKKEIPGDRRALLERASVDPHAEGWD